MLTTKLALREDPELYKDIHKALLKAFYLFETDHEKSIADIQKYLELDTEVLEADAYSRYSPNPEINVVACVDFWDMMNEIGYIDSDLDITDYLDTSAYDAAVDEIVEENPDVDFYKEVQKGGYGSNAE